MPRKYKVMTGLTYRAERALRGCIRGKWEPLASGKFDKPREAWCDCCTLLGCDKCPIAERAGMGGCKNTPYIVWCSSLRGQVYWPYTVDYNIPTTVAFAKKELRFLKDTLRLGLAARERNRK